MMDLSCIITLFCRVPFVDGELDYVYVHVQCMYLNIVPE
jgi:hypothetical protein